MPWYFSRKGQSSPLTEATGSQVKSKEAGYGEHLVTAPLSDRTCKRPPPCLIWGFWGPGDRVRHHVAKLLGQAIALVKKHVLFSFCLSKPSS